MTERAARRWAKQRERGRLGYALRSGSFEAARAFAVLFVIQFLMRGDRPSPVPVTVLLSGMALVAAISILLHFFRWNYLELQYFLFNKSQACSGSVSRA